MARKEPPAPEVPESEAAPSEGAHCPAEGPVAHKINVMAGASLAVLVSLLLNDPMAPAPIVVWATVVTVLTLGKAACIGTRWLAFHSPVAFPEKEFCPSPADCAVKLIPWIGFGVGVAGTGIGTLMALVCGRPPLELGRYLSMLLASFGPTAVLCLALLPWAWLRAQSASAFTSRDRGVFPIAAILLTGTLCALLHGMPPPPGAPPPMPPMPLWSRLLDMAWHALLPMSWPLHMIAVAVGVGFLRIWFRVCGKACGTCLAAEVGVSSE